MPNRVASFVSIFVNISGCENMTSVLLPHFKTWFKATSSATKLVLVGSQAGVFASTIGVKTFQHSFCGGMRLGWVTAPVLFFTCP